MTCVFNSRLVTWATLCPFLSLAQSIPSDTAAVPIREVVIQATRTSAGSPVPHSNFDANRIAQTLQAQDIPMLLSSVPSLVETSDGGVGVGYSGLRIRGSDPTRINVTINGVPFNDAESQQVYWVDLPDIAASAAEIQVQRGVGVSSNGAGAFGATVNLDLSRIAPDPGAVVSVTAGAFGTSRLSASAHTGLLSGKWSFAGRVSRIHSDGYIDRARTDLQSIHLTGAWLGERQTVQIHLLSGHENTYQAWNGVPAQYLDDPALRTFNTAGMERPDSPHPDEVDNYLQQHALLHYNLKPAQNWMLQLNGHFTRGRGYYEQYKSSQGFEQYGLAPWVIGDTVIAETNLIRRRWLDNAFYGGTFVLRWTGPDSGVRSAMLGGALSQYDGSHFGEIIWSEYPIGQQNDFRYYENDAKKQDANLYLKLESGRDTGWKAFLDVQARRIFYRFQGFGSDLQPQDQDVTHFFFNPKIGVTRALNGSGELYAFAGIAHREPNRDDYTQSSPLSRPKAEALYDFETGWRFRQSRVQATVNAFWMYYRNQLVLDGRINDVGAYIRTNVPDSYRAGVELETSFDITSRLEIVGNCMWSLNKVQSFREYLDDWDAGAQLFINHRNSDLAYSPSWVARLEAGWLVSRFGQPDANGNNSSIRLNVSGKYVGKQYLDNTSREQSALKGYFFSDLRLNVELNSKSRVKTSLIVSLNNWLNARYSSNGWIYRYISNGYDARPDDPYTILEGNGVYHQAGYFPQAGRHWMATARIEF